MSAVTARFGEAMRVLVTGSSGGIGGAVVASFGRLQPAPTIVGWDIVPPDASGPTDFRTVDHRDAEAVAAAAAELDAVDAVICAAGRALSEEFPPGPVLPGTEVMRAGIEQNLVGHYNVVRAALPRMAVGSSIVLVSSINALRSFGLVPYSIAKAGLHGLTVALAREAGRRGVRINAVALGTVDTDANSMEWQGVPGHRERMSRLSVTGAILSPDEAAHAIRAVALDLVGLTGQVVVVDNGQSISAPSDD